MKVLLTASHKFIHPALDFTKDDFFVGFYGRAQGENEKEIIETPMFLTKNGVLDTKELATKLLRPSKKLAKISKGFSDDFLNNFINLSVDSVSSVATLRVSEIMEKTKRPPIVTTLPTLTTLNTPFSILFSLLSRYVDFVVSVDAVYITLWAIGTYFFPIFNTYPYLFLNGLKQSGKTKTQAFLAQTCFNALHSGSITPSALFRIVDSYQPTLLIDEADALVMEKNAPELRTLLLNGYKKGARVLRSKQKGTQTDFEVEGFEVYCPKAISNILGIENVLEDRCVSITMLRTKYKQYAFMEIDENDELWQLVRDMMYGTLAVSWQEVQKAYGELQNDTELTGREWELWKPIFTLAKVFGSGKIMKQMVDYALQKSQEKKTENVTEQVDYLLVQILGDVIVGDNYYPVKDLTTKLLAKFDDEQKWLNTRWVGRSLKRLGFKEKRRVGAGVEYFLKKDMVDELFMRLQIEKPEINEDVREYSDNYEKIRKTLSKNFKYGLTNDEISFLSKIPLDKVEMIIKKMSELGEVALPDKEGRIKPTVFDDEDYK